MIDAAFHHGDGNTYYFSGNKVACVTGDGTPKVTDYPGPFSNMFTVGGKGIDAALRHGDDITHLFQGTRLMRYANRTTYRGPSRSGPLKDVWKNLPKDFEDGFDAAVRHGDGNSYFFSGSQCVRVPGNGYRADNDPQPINAVWKNLPDDFREGIDAALRYQNRTYFFCGNNFSQFTGDSMTADLLEDQGLPPGWHGLPSEFKENNQVLRACATGDGSSFEVRELETDNVVNPDSVFEIPPGGGIVLRCHIPEPAGPRLRIAELSVYEWPRKTGDTAKKKVKKGNRTDYDGGDASFRSTRTGVFLRHKHGLGKESHYYFGVTFEDESGNLHDWDPEVKDMPPPGGGARRARIGGGARFVLKRA